jgi:RNA polymerase sigma-70 factor (ECF subfamily)
MSATNETIDHIFREEYGRVVASLVRMVGDLDVAEEAIQDALVVALGRWQRDGIPANPGAWITTTAKRKAIDAIRRDQVRQRKYEQVALDQPTADNPFDESEDEDGSALEDDRLRLVFTCCHPSLALEARVALTLRTLGGLTTTEIARAFLIPEATLAQRLVRAKNKIRSAGIPYAVPSDDQLEERVEGVLAVIYLIFNEGYAASEGDQLLRVDLISEAIRMGGILANLMPGNGEVQGLLALMLLTDSRRAARQTSTQEPILLADQDRTLWDGVKIADGLKLLGSALDANSVGQYAFQASIAAVHARAETSADTDWRQISALYQALYQIAPSPVVLLNQAVAVAMAEGPERGLALIDTTQVAGALEGYRWMHSARADLLRRLGRNAEAAEEYERAIALSENATELAYLGRRLAALNVE